MMNHLSISLNKNNNKNILKIIIIQDNKIFHLKIVIV